MWFAPVLKNKWTQVSLGKLPCDLWSETMTVKHCEIPLKRTPTNTNLPNGWLEPKRDLGVRGKQVAEYWEEQIVAFCVFFARLNAHSSHGAGWDWLNVKPLSSEGETDLGKMLNMGMLWGTG